MLNECLKEEMINTSQSCHVLIVRNENKPNLELSFLICGKFIISSSRHVLAQELVAGKYMIWQWKVDCKKRCLN